MNILELAILKKMVGGGGGSGTDNYNDLSNLPQINGETLAGNKSSSNLGLQDEIDSDNKLASDLVDDENQENKFVTSSEKNTWNAKQNAIDSDHKLDADLVDDSESINKFVTATDKEAWNAKQNAIDADHKLSSSLVSFSEAEAAALASGIDSSKVGQISTNQTNILYTLGKTGKNIFDFDAWIDGLTATRGTFTTSGNSITITATDNDCSTDRWNPSSSVSPVFKIPTKAGEVIILQWNADLSQASNGGTVYVFPNGSPVSPVWTYASSTKITFTVPSDCEFITFRFGVARSGETITFSNIMICTQEDWNISPDYQPYRGLPNYDLTRLEQQDRNALVEVIDKGAKNRFDFDNWSIGLAATRGTITVSGKSFVITATENDAFTDTWGSSSPENYKIPVKQGETIVLSWTANLSQAENSGAVFIFPNGLVTGSVSTGAESTTGLFFTVPSGCSFITVRFGVRRSGESITYSDIMISTLAEFEVSQNYAPFALPNTDLTRMVNDLQKKVVKVYTYHVNPNESDPEDAVTYLDDATGLTPAKMGASSFSYGSWANAWFLPRPCVLKFDGTVDYYLNPNDYSKKTDGTASTIDSSNTTGNVMLEFPKIWVKRVNDGNGARTVSIAPVNVDGTYKCWSNINAEDKEVDHFYLPAYNGTIHSSKMRSLSGVTLDTTHAPNYTRAQEVTAATANNPTGKNLWYTETWADFCLIYDLLYLMGKSLDVQRTFGQGLSNGAETAMRAYVTGTHNAKGLFYGDISETSTAVKVLGMENLWGCRWHGVAGLINDNGTLKVKMTYGVADGSTAVGYNATGSGYLNYGSTYGTNGYVKKMQADNTMGYKIIETAGTDATYYCDFYYVNSSQSNYALLGGYSGSGASCGFCVNLTYVAAHAYWAFGGSLSCRP